MLAKLEAQILPTAPNKVVPHTGVEPQRNPHLNKKDIYSKTNQ
jgi:hypothetical protein